MHFLPWSVAILWAATVLMQCQAEEQQSKGKAELLVVTVATEANDGFKQLERSTKKYGLQLKVFGMGEQWKGGDMQNRGGGHKINLLREGLKQYRNKEDLIIMFTDAYDSVLTGGQDAILEKFSKFDARIVFSAEDACWPDKTLAEKYPTVMDNEKRFLCSGGFIGYAPEIYEMINYQPVADTDDDQLYYTKLFLNRALRHEWNIKLDSKAEIFINLHMALSEIVLRFKDDDSYLFNIRTGSSPIVVHGNGPIKPEFYRLSNYLAGGWTTSKGCMSCDEDLLDISELKEEEYPKVTMALFVEIATPFIREFFQRIAALDYPKSKIDLYIHNKVDFHTKDVNKFLDNTKDKYASVRVISPSDNVGEAMARNWAMSDCVKKSNQYLFTVESVAQLTNPEVLKDLITQNRSIIVPALKRINGPWSNFWGALNDNGFYARSTDYMDIVDKKRIGVWNVPFVTNVILIQASKLPALEDAYTYKKIFDPDMSFCAKARDQVVFMYATNRKHWGHLIYPDEFETSHLHNELFEIFNNRYDWELRYLHENYSQSLKDGAEIEMPCPDVYWFPIMSDTFCDEFVAEFENCGQWSSGKNEDPRLAGGYENVPTVDIHMNQCGYERHWLHILGEFVRPLQERVFTGYFHNPPHAIMNFIVRYKPDEQPLLRPHHDASTYTINIALNRPGIDFEGGGCRFIRYDCAITSPRKGWMFMHPGRLTHYHEGLRVTNGTRYIMISFIDP